jgi:hypothetical protein
MTGPIQSSIGGRGILSITRLIREDIDVNAVYQRLSILAVRLTKAMPGIFDGVSADDLVGETILDYLAGDLAWDPGKGSLDRFLCGVLRNKFRKHAHRNLITSRVVANPGNVHSSQSGTQETAERSSSAVEEIRRIAHGDKELSPSRREY